MDSSIKGQDIEDSCVVGDMENMSGAEINADQMEAALKELNAEPDHIPSSQNRYNPLRARRWLLLKLIIIIIHYSYEN